VFCRRVSALTPTFEFNQRRLEMTPRVAQQTGIRPFHANDVPEAELAELRRRINATKWPERETVTDASQGVQLATIQALAHYWATDYDWRGWTSISLTSVHNTKMRCR
jgi:hypothetical protein